MNTLLKALPLVSTVFAFLLLTSCRTNELPQYMPVIESAHVTTFANARPAVDIGSHQEKSALSEIAEAGVTLAFQERLTKIVSIESMAVTLSDAFVSQLQPSFPFTLIANQTDPRDVNIEVELDRFGLTASDITNPVYYFVSANARMIYVPENKLIWEYSTTIEEPLNDLHFSGGLIGTTMNLDALNSLTDEEILAIFDALSEAVGIRIVEQMREDSVVD